VKLARILSAARRIGDLVRERSGVVAPMVAVLGVSLIGAAGVALDVGLYYTQNRNLRAATEAAALAAAGAPARASARASEYLALNGYPGLVPTVEVGYYCANIARNSSSRFVPSGSPDLANCPGSSVQNAVRVTTRMASTRYLTQVLGGANPIPDLQAVASAARIDEAGIAVSSDILQLTKGKITGTLIGAVNGLLGGLLGITLNLSAPDIQTLMKGTVNAGLFFDKLAERVDHTGTYGELVEGTYGFQDIAHAAADAAGDANVARLLRLIGSAGGNDYRVPLKGLFGLGVWKNIPVAGSAVTPSLRAGLNAYQLVAFAAQLGPGVIDASNLVSLAVPGSIVKISAVASGPIDRPRFAFGPAGETEVGTSALRLQVLLSDIKLDVSALGLLSLEVSDVPVLIDVAAASAAIAPDSGDFKGIDCADSAEQKQTTRVSVDARSGLVNAYIGTAPANAMTKPIPPITADDIGQATLLDLKVAAGLVRVTAKARAIAQPVFGNSDRLTFGPGGDGTIGTTSGAGVAASVGNGSQVATTIDTLVNSLISGLDVDVTVLGACLPIICSKDRSLIEATILGALLPALTAPVTGLVGTAVDPLLDVLLAALGIELGHAGVWVTGARCGVPVLI